MTCSECRSNIDAFLDLELDAANSRRLSDHLENCENCRRIVESKKRLSTAIKGSAVALVAPTAIVRRFRERNRRRRRLAIGFMSLGLVSAIGAFSVGVIWQPWVLTDERVSSDLIADHQAVVAEGYIVKVGTKSPEAVSAWFKARNLGFEPTVKDLSTSGLTLVGGRIDKVDGVDVAAIVYSVNNVPISLFVSSNALPGPVDLDKDGVQARTWNDCGLNYWAVSKAGGQYLETIHRTLLGRKY